MRGPTTPDRRRSILTISDPGVCYWLREGESRAEVGFVIQAGRSLILVEVKADLPLVLRFGFNPPSLSTQEHRLLSGSGVSYQLLSLPLYMAEECDRLIEHIVDPTAS